MSGPLACPVHPFRVRRNASDPAHWIDAGDLTAGEQIETQNGRWAVVQSATPVKGLTTVYNFTVEEDHDYFVGEQGLLVHNAGETTVFLPSELMPESVTPDNPWGLFTYGATGYRGSDLTALNKASGLTAQEGYVALHVLYDPETNTMVGQYVRRDAHAPSHTGGGDDFHRTTGGALRYTCGAPGSTTSAGGPGMILTGAVERDDLCPIHSRSL